MFDRLKRLINFLIIFRIKVTVKAPIKDLASRYLLKNLKTILIDPFLNFSRNYVGQFSESP